MVTGSKESENKTLKRDYGDRLRAAMIEKGYKAPRSRLGADPKALAVAAGVKSLEMSRKYIMGESLPSPTIRKRIAEWLGMRQAYLEYGELPKYPHEVLSKVDPVCLSQCIEAVQAAAERTGTQFSQKQLAKAAAFIYEEVVTGGKIDHQRVIDLLKILD